MRSLCHLTQQAQFLTKNRSMRMWSSSLTSRRRNLYSQLSFQTQSLRQMSRTSRYRKSAPGPIGKKLRSCLMTIEVWVSPCSKAEMTKNHLVKVYESREINFQVYKSWLIFTLNHWTHLNLTGLSPATKVLKALPKRTKKQQSLSPARSL